MSIYYTEGLTEAAYLTNFYVSIVKSIPKIWFFKNKDGVYINRYDRSKSICLSYDEQAGQDDPFVASKALLEGLRQNTQNYEKEKAAYIVVDDDVYVDDRNQKTKTEFENEVEKYKGVVLWQGRNFEDFIAMHLPTEMWNLWQKWSNSEEKKRANGKVIKNALNRLMGRDNESLQELEDKLVAGQNWCTPEERVNLGVGAEYNRWFERDNNHKKYFIMGLVRCKYRLSLIQNDKICGWFEDEDVEPFQYFQSEDIDEVLMEMKREDDRFFCGDEKNERFMVQMMLKAIKEQKRNS
ncbi:MAG: hypothetical protein IKZ34_03055 [Alphaproteobacteria bacterium]|nr:hypothetical protein [Alphaproteobacteria bacterium]